ncbi:MAG: replication-relaxation family protein [Chloroflexi bacterium]|nr:replication-relaxation family protein [Chloroflexota bacterium]
MPPDDTEDAAAKLRESPGAGTGAAHLLPLALNATQKRLLELTALWPWLTNADLSGISGLPESKVASELRWPVRQWLVEKRRVAGRLRITLSDRGLALLARRDRVNVQGVLRQWSAASYDDGGHGVAGTRARDLARHLGHTAAVYRFFAELGRQARAQGGELLLALPPHRAQRSYVTGGRVSHIKPDGYGHVKLHGGSVRFFLEWEQRAAHPAQFRAKLAAYLSYYRTGRAQDDYGAPPVLLVVLRDELVESGFLSTALRLRTGQETPAVLATYAELLRDDGPLGPIWRSEPGGGRTWLALLKSP